MGLNGLKAGLRSPVTGVEVGVNIILWGSDLGTQSNGGEVKLFNGKVEDSGVGFV